jgi:hypothetical protein
LGGEGEPAALGDVKPRVSELGSKNALRSRPPGVDKKILVVAVAVAVCSPKAPRKKALMEEIRKCNVGNTSSSIIRPEKTKSLESSKRKRKASKGDSDAEVQAASSLAQLGQKKSKKVVKKIVVATVQRVPSAFSDDEMTEESRLTSFSSCFWCDLRFSIRRSYTPGSENEFVDVETFSKMSSKFKRPPLVLLLLLIVRLVLPKLPPLQTQLL